MSVAGDTAYYGGSLVEQIAVATAILHLPDTNVIKPLVLNESRDRADTITIPVWNQGSNKLSSSSMAGHSGGADATERKYNSDKKTGTLAAYGFYLPVEDDSTYSNLEDVGAKVGLSGAAVVGAKIDNLIATLFTSFSGNEAGLSTVAMTVDMVFQALNLLKTDLAPEPYSGVLHPGQIWGTYGISNDLVTSNQFGGSPAIQAKHLEDGFIGTANNFVGMLAGIGIYTSSEVPTGSNASEGLVFSKAAMAFGWVPPLPRVEVRRPGRELQDSYIFSMWCDAWEVVDNYGCTIHTKTS